MIKIIAASLGLALMSGSVLAARPMTEIDAMKQTAWEAMECMVYYKVAMQCTMKDYPQGVSSLQRSMETAGMVSAITGKGSGMSDDAMLAMQDVIVRQETEAMQRDCTNLVVLINKYASCKGILTNPKAHIQSLIGSTD